MKYLCLYYSATGNTARAVEIVRREIETDGSRFDAIPMKTAMKKPEPGGYDGLVVAFPVLAFAAPVFVRKILRGLPSGKSASGERMKVWVLAVDGGGGETAAAGATAILEARGYDVVSSARASYPDNWVELVEPPTPEACERMIRSGDGETLAFAREMVSGAAADPGANRKTSAALGTLSALFGLVGRRFLGKLFFADGDCDGCGACVRRCPSGSILLESKPGAKPFWKMNCENCNACMNLCPKNAVNTSVGRLVLYLSLIVALSVVLIVAYAGPFKAAIGWNLPAAAGTAVDIVVMTGLVLIAHFLPIGPFDRYVVRYLSNVPGFRAFFAWTFTKRFRRYSAAKIRARA